MENFNEKTDFSALVKAIMSSRDAGLIKNDRTFINMLRTAGTKVKTEEVSRRNKPSNIKKKKSLDVALEKLKKKKESLSEEPERTSAYKSMQKKLYPRGSTIDAKTGEGATSHRVGGWKDPRNRDKKSKRNRGYGALKSKLMSKEDFEGVLRKDDPARRTPGKTITTKAKTVGYEKGDLPADKKKKLPKSKSTAIVKTDDKTDDKNDKKQKLTPNTPGKDRVAQGGPIEKAKEKEKQGIKDYTNKKKGVIARRKAKERLKNAAKNLAQGAADNATKVTGGVASAYGTSSFKEDRTSNWRSELSEVAPALALPLIPLANKAIATGAAAWSLYNMSKRRKESPGQMNIPGFQRTWGKSKPDPVRDELNKRRDASKTRKVNKAQSAAARDRENAARKSRGEGELNNPEN